MEQDAPRDYSCVRETLSPAHSMTFSVTALSSLIVAFAAAGSITSLALESLATGEVWGYYGKFSRAEQPAMFAFYMGNYFGILTLATFVFAKALGVLM